jgi:hypothetical protein
MAIAAKIPMMATTIINSMSVKPCCIFLSILTPGDEHENLTIEQRLAPVTGNEQASCQAYVPIRKYMKYLSNQENVD